jgi:hypothetical protein
MKNVLALVTLAALAATTSLFPFVAKAETPPSRQRPDSVLGLIRDIDRAEPVSEPWLTNELAGQLTCSATDIPYGDTVKHRLDCDAYNVKLGTDIIGHINFRSVDAGSLLMISGLKGECVPISKLVAATDPVDSGCTDGATCLYAKKQRPWGTLSVAVPSEATAAQCTTQVIFRSGL